MLLAKSQIICMIWDVFPGLDLYYTDPAQHLIAAGLDPDDLSVDDLSVGRVKFSFFYPFRTAVPFWGQTTQILSNLSPKRDCGTKRIITPDVLIGATACGTAFAAATAAAAAATATYFCCCRHWYCY